MLLFGWRQIRSQQDPGPAMDQVSGVICCLALRLFLSFSELSLSFRLRWVKGTGTDAGLILEIKFSATEQIRVFSHCLVVGSSSEPGRKRGCWIPGTPQAAHQLFS